MSPQRSAPGSRLPVPGGDSTCGRGPSGLESAASRPPRAPALAPAALALLLVWGPACGKKGPPLPPLNTLPRAPEAVTARLQGNQVQIWFRIPRATQSNIQPANLQRVDVYALTGPHLSRDEFVENATIVASVPVRRPVVEGEEDAPPAPGEEDALEQGAMAVVFETLTPAALTPVTPPGEDEKKEDRRRRSGVPIVVRRTALAPPDIGTPVPQAPMRHYVAVGVTRGGKKGMPSTIASVSLEPAPPSPPAPVAKVQEGAAVALTWDPPAGLRKPIQRTTLTARTPARPGEPRRGGPLTTGRGTAGDADGFGEPGEADEDLPGEGPVEDDPGEDADDELPEVEAETAAGEEGEEEDTAPADAAGDALPAEGEAGDGATSFLPARPLLPWPSVASGYHVYAVPAEPSAEPPSPYSADALPELLTPRPVPKPEFTDSKARFGQERCYVVRVAEAVGSAVREGPPSQPACVKVADVFPPAAPESLEAVASDGAVSLIWQGNSETDLAGYLVIRSEEVETRIQQLTPKPIAEATFRDTDVKPGTRYVYVVVAVDSAEPPNRSGPSNAVTVTAR